jgi:hypothetical protein
VGLAVSLDHDGVALAGAPVHLRVAVADDIGALADFAEVECGRAPTRFRLEPARNGVRRAEATPELALAAGRLARCTARLSTESGIVVAEAEHRFRPARTQARSRTHRSAGSPWLWIGLGAAAAAGVAIAVGLLVSTSSDAPDLGPIEIIE